MLPLIESDTQPCQEKKSGPLFYSLSIPDLRDWSSNSHINWNVHTFGTRIILLWTFYYYKSLGFLIFLLAYITKHRSEIIHALHITFTSSSGQFFDASRTRPSKKSPKMHTLFAGKYLFSWEKWVSECSMEKKVNKCTWSFTHIIISRWIR